jgi:hypothetical protein
VRAIAFVAATGVTLFKATKATKGYRRNLENVLAFSSFSLSSSLRSQLPSLPPAG